MFRVPTLEQKDLTGYQTLEMSTALDKVTLRNQKPEARNKQGGKARVEMHKFKVIADIGAMGSKVCFYLVSAVCNLVKSVSFKGTRMGGRFMLCLDGFL